MLKSITEVIKESYCHASCGCAGARLAMECRFDPPCDKCRIQTNYQTLKTVICDDCMKGRHDIAGNITCECACHNNPQCFVCGHNIFGDDIHVGSHPVCEIEFNDALNDEILDSMITKYGRDSI